MDWVDKLNLTFMLLMEVFLVVALFKAGNDRKGLEWLILKAFLLAGVIFFGLYLLPNFVASSGPQDSSAMTATGVVEQGAEDAPDDGSPSSTVSEPTYSDPRWPTTNAELLAIPEADRWYNSWKRVDSYGTIAGPVASVAYLDDRIMVNIGADYPDPDRAQIVIWAERWDDFKSILNDIDYGNAWVSVSGKIKEFDGVAEIDVNDSETEWTRWTEDPTMGSREGP